MNPTGSYKGRIASATMRDALRRGARGWVGTSSGNGGAAMSAYGARAGLAGFLCIAADAPPEDLTHHAPEGATLAHKKQRPTEARDKSKETPDAADRGNDRDDAEPGR